MSYLPNDLQVLFYGSRLLWHFLLLVVGGAVVSVEKNGRVI